MALTFQGGIDSTCALIANGVKAQLEARLYDELMEYVKPRVKSIAVKCAEDVAAQVIAMRSTDMLTTELHINFTEKTK